VNRPHPRSPGPRRAGPNAFQNAAHAKGELNMGINQLDWDRAMAAKNRQRALSKLFRDKLTLRQRLSIFKRVLSSMALPACRKLAAQLRREQDIVPAAHRIVMARLQST
jgi:hypothetical protein